MIRIFPRLLVVSRLPVYAICRRQHHQQLSHHFLNDIWIYSDVTIQFMYHVHFYVRLFSYCKSKNYWNFLDIIPLVSTLITPMFYLWLAHYYSRAAFLQTVFNLNFYCKYNLGAILIYSLDERVFPPFFHI